MSEVIERCAGCGIRSRDGHPMVGVMNQADAAALEFDPATLAVSERGFVAVPVCHACYADPAHRVYPLKCSFFRREDTETARARAGTNDLALPVTSATARI